MKFRNLIIIGAGVHFREKYYPILKSLSGKVRIKLIVDLLSEKEKIEGFFSEHELKSENCIFLPEECRNNVSFKQIDQLVLAKIDIKTIDAVMICTEPKVRKTYALWAIYHNFHIFADKPLSAFSSSQQTSGLYEDYLEIEKALSKKKLNFVLSCERRMHPGYTYIKQYISNIIKEFKVPITFVDLHFSGGNWVMPDEFFIKENHPYKYGYGVPLHSGYHYIDVLVSLLSLNNALFPISFNDLDLNVLATTPFDVLSATNNNLYADLFKTNRFVSCFESESLDQLKNFGQTSVLAMGSLKKNNATITNFNLKLIDTSVSKRSWHQSLDDHSRVNGRIRQENLIIHIGHLCSIHVNSNPYSKLLKEKYDIEDFSITILNHPEFIKQDPVIQIKRSDLSRMFPDLKDTDSINIRSRQKQLIEFLNGKKGNSSIFSHKNTIRFLDAIYKKL